MKKLALGLVVLLWPGSLAVTSASEVTIDSSEQLFVVLAAASLGGLNPWLDQGNLPPEVSELWVQLRLLPVETIPPLRAFVSEHRQGTTRQDLGRYISLALILGEPPEFDYLLPVHQLPPDVKEIQDFRFLVRNFYAEANLRALWRRYQPLYERQLARLQHDVTQALLRTRGYLRLLGEGTGGRRYTVLLDWLVPPGLSNARQYVGNYSLVINPMHPDLLPAVRHQYLHFLVDPLAARHAPLLQEKSTLLEVARRAPRLPASYREDFLLLATECLIQATELRVDGLTGASLAARLDDFERQGYVLTRYFHRALGRLEQTEPSFELYFRELLDPLDPDRERARLEQITFAPAEEEASDPEPATRSGAELLLVEAERQMLQKNYETARMIFERVLSEYNKEEPRALYGLGVIASIQRDAERARYYLERTARVAQSPHILGWTHVYLGRLYDLEGQREAALAEYRAALAIPGVPGRIQEAARRGLEAPFRPLLRETQP